MKQITLPKWAAVGEVAAANIIPALLVLKPTELETCKDKATVEKRKADIKKNY